MKKSRPPAHLEGPGREFFTRFVTEHHISDYAGVQLVVRAAEALDRMAQVRASIEEAGLVVPNRYGNLVENPACRMEREYHRAFLSAMRLLDKITS